MAFVSSPLGESFGLEISALRSVVDQNRLRLKGFEGAFYSCLRYWLQLKILSITFDILLMDMP